MRFLFVSLAALAQAVYVTETAYQTFYVTVDDDNEAALPTGYDQDGPAYSQASPYTQAPAASSPSAYDWPSSEASEFSAPAQISFAEASAAPAAASIPAALDTNTTSTKSVPTAFKSNSIAAAAVPTAARQSNAIPAALTTSDDWNPNGAGTPQGSGKPAQASKPKSSATGSSAASASSSAPSGLASDIVNYHNKVRALHHVGDVTWSSELADYASNYLSSDNCVFKHSGGEYGENIALGYSSIDEAQDAWYNEEDQYDYAAGQFSEATGHFTQMVWKGTTEVGCATADCSGGTFLVCEYSPRGNIIGEFTENVLPE